MKPKFLLSALALATAASSAQAGEIRTFVIDKAQSQWTWQASGLGVQAVPNTTNQLEFFGTITVDLEFDGNGEVSKAIFIDANIQVDGDLSGYLPNPIPLFPPLATFGFSNVLLSKWSLPLDFALPSTGAWDGDVIFRFKTGTLDLDLLTSGPSQTDLAYLDFFPQFVSGDFITTAGPNVELDTPQSHFFQAVDPGTQLTADITLTGRIVAHAAPPAACQPDTYCTGKINSIGCTPQIWSEPGCYTGGHYEVRVNQLLHNKPGIIFYGLAPASIPFQGSFLCVAPPIQRTPVQTSGGSPPDPVPDCTGTMQLDISVLGLVPGQDYYFQGWSRDPNATASTSLSNGLRVPF